MTLIKARDFYKQMLLIRRFEEKCVELYSNQDIRGFMHLYIGEEAIAVGVMSELSENDSVLATYREHGQALARGLSAKSIIAEMFGKLEGCSHGRGGSMHLFDVKKRFYGGSAIVGGGLPLAVGMALADKMMKRERVTVCFFGDGAVAEGEFHESVNLAVLWELPILFVCENNFYGMGTALEFAQSEINIAKKAASYRIISEQINGMSVIDVAKATKKSLKQIRSGNGPVFLECLTYRFRAHSLFDPELYRSKEEVEEWKKKGPLQVFQNDLEKMGLWSKLNIKEIEEEIEVIIKEAIEFAQHGTIESTDDLEKFVYSLEVEHA